MESLDEDESNLRTKIVSQLQRHIEEATRLECYEKKLLSQIDNISQRPPNASADDDTGTQFLDRLMKKQEKIEGMSRVFSTNEQREDYLSKMNQMHEKYANLEQRIGKMNEKRWNTDQVLNGIEHNLESQK